MELARCLEACALEEGFVLASVLDLELAQNQIIPHVERYDRWIDEGNAGAMQYLERGRDRRADPRAVMPEALSVLCVALPYPKHAGGASSSEQGPRYARYINGRDYHEVIAEKLEHAMRAAAKRAGLGESLKWKICVDTSAVLERSWAALAGLGWIGKNTLLIHPKLGSYLFLGEVLINQATGQGPRPMSDYCGHCTRCLKACPTEAIREPHWVDSRRCISYWTLEKRGELVLSEKDKLAIGTWVAGCDLCQEVCPFNFKPVALENAAGIRTEPQVSDWERLLQEDLANYRERVAHSALNRVKPAQFSRNLAIALGNTLLTDETGALSRLEPWVQKRLSIEQDPAARAEWERCLGAFSERSRLTP